VWLGAATAVARVLDASSVLVVMWFVSRAEIGVATLAWSVAVFVEAMNGMGLNTALLQVREITHARLSSAFWYIMGVATLLVLGVSALSLPLAHWFGHDRLAPMLVVASTKLWFVGAALIPLNQLNRHTRFEKIAAVSTGATLCSGTLTCVLAALRFGAWALVLGQVSHGLFTALFANLAHPFRPRGRPSLTLIRDDIAFGAKVASSGLLQQFYRNADYYFIGRMLGAEPLGLYRVAFDLAMAPTQAVSMVVNRSALPVYARMAERPAELRDAFLWTLRSLAILLAPVTAILAFAAEDLLGWVQHGAWLDAAPMVRWLAAAALLRCIAQTFPQLFHALKRPAFALYDSAITATLLCALLFGGLTLLGGRYGVEVAAWAWVALHPLSLISLLTMTRALMPLRAGELLGALRGGALAMLAMGAAELAFRLLEPALAPGLGRAVVHLGLIVGAFLAYVRVVLGVTLRTLTRR
jgi:O-antigen/teichoic acid export membrane protein